MRISLVLAVATALAACQPEPSSCPDCARPWPPARPGYDNPIPAENARTGDFDWADGLDPAAPQRLDVYLDAVSTAAGGTVQVMASAEASHDATWTLYRFGWYAGAGARAVASGDAITVWKQADCPLTPWTGLVRCAWDPVVSIHVPDDALAGLYAIKLTRDDGVVRFAPLVVVDNRPADLLLQASVNTYQAYNDYGGESLYKDGSHNVPGGKGLQVSFDRPYVLNRGLSSLLTNELPFARFLERNGYDVSYTTNVDVAINGWPHLFRAGAFLSVGHDEYWSGAEREAVEQARDSGVPVLFFGANAAYWKVRYEDEPDSAIPRVMTCYKSHAVPDPVDGLETTGRFRDLGRPENALVGGYYGGWQVLTFSWIASVPTSWLLAGTGLQEGEALPLVVGDEFDRRGDNGAAPEGLEVLARAPVITADGRPDWAETLAYRASSGALVFDAGTIDWPRALDLDSPSYDSRVERMTANVLKRALGLAIPRSINDTQQRFVRTAAGPFAATVDTLTTGLVGPFGVAAHPLGTIVVDSARHSIYRVSRGAPPILLAGDGSPSRTPSGGAVPAAQARFFNPTTPLTLSDGAILVADSGNHCIRRIGTDAARTVTIFAGQLGSDGYADAPAGQPGQARFSYPTGLALDPATGAVLVADSRNHRVRAVWPDGHVSTVAGSALGDVDGPAATARFAYPTAVAAAADGRIFVISTFVGKVKVIQPDAARTVVTLAGNGAGYVDGDGLSARFGALGGAAWTGTELVFADPANLVVRALTPGTDAASSTVRTVAGSGNFGDDDGAGGRARFGLPVGVALSPDRGLYVVDAAGGSVRILRP